MRDMRKAWFEKNREVQFTLRLNYKLRDLGVNIWTVEGLFLEQGGRCAICTAELNIGERYGYALDHNHETGEIRGLLCNTCNGGLGSMRDSPEILDRAVEYLQERGHYGKFACEEVVEP